MGVLGKNVKSSMKSLEGLVKGAEGVVSDAVRDAASIALRDIAVVDETLRPMMSQTTRDNHDNAYNEGMNKVIYIEQYRNSLTPETLLAAVEKYHDLVVKYINPNNRSRSSGPGMGSNTA